MFSADVSWVQEDRETVGQRKDRKRAQSTKSAASKTRDCSSRASDSGHRDTPTNTRRPVIRKASQAQSLNSHPVHVEDARPPVPQWNDICVEAQKFLTPTPEFVLEQICKHADRLSDDNDLLARRRNLHKHSLPSLTNSYTPRSSQDTALSRDPREEVMDHLYDVHHLNGGDFVSHTNTRSTKILTPEEYSPRMLPVDGSRDALEEAYENASRYKVQSRSRYSPEDRTQDLSWGYDPAMDMTSMQLSMSTMDAWKDPNYWDVVPPTPTSISEASIAPSSDSVHRGNYTSVEANTGDLINFQRFIRKMQQGSPKIILDRLNKDWSPPATEEERDNQALEKHLWVLTAFQLKKEESVGQLPDSELQSSDHSGDTKPKHVLEMYGNLAEVYQLSAMNPHDKIKYLSTRQQSTVPLPCNVSYLTVPHAGMTPMPYATTSFDRIRTSCLPSLIPLTKLPPILQECNRILCPGGVMEVRIVPPSPKKETMGPKMTEWMNERLLISLERSFRSLRPALSMPGWLKGAGLIVQQPTQVVKLPAATDPATEDVDNVLAAHIARTMWADTWGQHMEDRQDQDRWWWQSEEIVQECVQYGTVFEFETLLAIKQ